MVESSVACLDRFSEEDRERIRRCLEIIISGQKLDLERFADASSNNMVSLQNDSELDDYACIIFILGEPGKMHLVVPVILS